MFIYIVCKSNFDFFLCFLYLQSRELTGFFSFREIDRKRVGISLQKSLQDLVDQSAPTASIQFRLACRGVSGVRIKAKGVLTDTIYV